MKPPTTVDFYWDKHSENCFPALFQAVGTADGWDTFFETWIYQRSNHLLRILVYQRSWCESLITSQCLWFTIIKRLISHHCHSQLSSPSMETQRCRGYHFSGKPSLLPLTGDTITRGSSALQLFPTTYLPLSDQTFLLTINHSAVATVSKCISMYQSLIINHLSTINLSFLVASSSDSRSSTNELP